MRRVAAALIHYPVLDRQGDIVTAAITNIDLHDISRSALSFGLDGLYVVHPVAAQRELADRIRSHWVEGSGGRRIPDRKPALAGLHTVPTLDDALAQLGVGAEMWTTSARAPAGKVLDYDEARRQLELDGPDVLLCFGTGWGIAPMVQARAAWHLQPVRSARRTDYNHLSVRAAAAIIFDRLLGER